MHRRTPSKTVDAGIVRIARKVVDNVHRADLNEKKRANTPAHVRFCRDALAVVRERIVG